MCMSVFACLCECAFEDQRRVLDALGLELQVVVSQSVGTCNQTHILCNSNKCMFLLSHLSSPQINFNNLKIKT